MASRSTEFGSVLEDSGLSVPDVESTLLEPLAGVAFWAAIALPFLHLPLLLTTGLDSTTTASAFVVLLALNVVTLVVGHPHTRD